MQRKKQQQQSWPARSVLLLLLAKAQLGQPFAAIQFSTKSVMATSCRVSVVDRKSKLCSGVLFAKDASSGDEKDKIISNALDRLSSLGSLDNEAEKQAYAAAQSIGKTKPDKSLSEILKDIDLTEIKEAAEPTTTAPEKDLEVFKGMLSQAESQSETEMYTEVIDDLKGNTSVPSLLSNIPDFDPTISSQNFMDKAFEDAINEIQSKTGSEVDVSAVLDNEELKKEIEKIFDHANKELVQSIEDMKKEQEAWAKKSMDERSKRTDGISKEEEARLEAAEKNMRLWLERVNKETREVEKAVEELKKAQASAEGDSVDRLAKLKSGGIAKQATFVGAILFAARSFTDVAITVGGDSTHLLPAAVQGAIAVSCLVAFLAL